MSMLPTATEKARKRANTWVFSGEEAVHEVAKYDGFWDWVMLMPEEELSVRGGGRGGILEMAEARADIPHHFGLLRMCFGELEKTKWIQVSTCVPTESEDAKLVRQDSFAKACEMISPMNAKISTYANVAVSVSLNRAEEFTPEFLIEKLCEAFPEEKEHLTMRAYLQAREVATRAHLEDDEDEEDAEDTNILNEMMLEAPQALEMSGDQKASLEVEEDKELVKQRKPMRLYSRGDYVQVYSNAANSWHDDGVIIEVTEEKAMRDGFSIPAGSMKAQYSGGRRFKWVTPTQSAEFLKPSLRPVAPPPMTGDIFKETHNFFSEWHVRHFQLNKGFLQWWHNAEQAKAGAPPNRTISLMGLVIADSGSCFKVRSASTKGVIYRFDAKTQENCQRWVASIRKHWEYVVAMKEHMRTQRSTCTFKK